MSSYDEKCPLGIETIAEDLVNKLEGEIIPSDYEPGDYEYAQILAEIRHTYTNYEELLMEMDQMANCIEYYHSGNICSIGEFAWDNLDGECDPKQFAHDTLKWAARDLAKELYNDWLESHK